MSRNILNLSDREAKDFFLEESSYHNFDLPPYFLFEPLLKNISDNIGRKHLHQLLKSRDNKPNQSSEVNYRLFGSKNGNYDWRKFQIIHPVLYVLLVNTITRKENWESIQELLTSNKSQSKVICASLPVVSTTKYSHKAEQIKAWSKQVERESQKLALEFDYIYQTDITGFYSSIYTHSISWALHTKDVAKTQNGDLLGSKIDKLLMAMSYNQTNGIPEGSVIMDFLAEILLSYADVEFTKAIDSYTPSKAYRIIRYRDDYRIFVNDPLLGEEIIKKLTEVLLDLGLKLNSTKTHYSKNILSDSIKPDKLDWLMQDYDSQLKHSSLTVALKIIYNFSIKYPNSGTISKQLSILYKKYNKKDGIYGDKELQIAYLVNIAIQNQRVFPICMAFISKLLIYIPRKPDRAKLLKNILSKVSKLPNTSFSEIWIQRITIKGNYSGINYNEPICKLAEGQDFSIWDSSWLKDDVKTVLDKTPIFNQEVLEKLDKVVSPKEANPFAY